MFTWNHSNAFATSNRTAKLRSRPKAILLVITGCLLLFPLEAWSQGTGKPKKHDPHRWDKQIAAFEKADQETAPPKNGILFVGSSSIRYWKVEASFPGMPVINRGFGGSEISDAIFFADRIIIKHRPKIIVFYAGDNDLARGKSSQQVVADYQTFVKTIQGSLPKTRIIFVAIKPSISRWKLIETIRKTNQQIEQITTTDSRQFFLDVDTPMIGADGKPKPELFIKDGLHLNAAGYKLWNSLLKPLLKAAQ